MNKIWFAACLVAFSSGCATTGAGAAKQAEFQAGVPVCWDAQECKIAWEAAQVWVAQHSQRKIQTATDVLIETYGSGPNEPTLAMRVIKERVSGERYKIVFSGGCNNMFGCVPNVYDAGIEFNAAITRAINTK